jgi:thiol:disulfide interchange protein
MPTIDGLASQYPTLHVYKYEIQNDANYSLFQQFLSAYNLTFDTVPTIIVGKQKFQGDEYTTQIQAAVAQGVQKGATGPGDVITGHIVPTPTPKPGNATKNSTSSAQNSTLVNTQGELPLGLFITTGIISGINPCVFSVLIFLMGTIALTASRGRALAIGVTYIATVFVVFFLTALAVVQFVRVIGASNLALTKTAIGIFLLVVGIVSIKDFFWYNRWFSFKIPTFTKHSISTLGKTGSFLAIMGLGFIATVAALPCTIGPFTYFSTTYACDAEQPLHRAVFVGVRLANDPRVHSDLRGQGEHGQGRRMETEISAIYEACSRASDGIIWAPAHLQSILKQGRNFHPCCMALFKVLLTQQKSSSENWK